MRPSFGPQDPGLAGSEIGEVDGRRFRPGQPVGGADGREEGERRMIA
jgi:hypothetical protein